MPPITSTAQTQRREVILSVRNVSRIYKMGDVETPALRDASLDLYRGELVIVVGASGSGKTTLLNMIGGMDRPTSGQVLFGDKDLTGATDAELTRFRRDSIGFVFQFYNLVPSLTALENVQVATELSPHPMDAMAALEMVGLVDRADHFPAQMSGGEQQRVSIARAVAKDPDIMLCDEPTGALDIENGKQVLAVLVKMKRELGKTIVIITHNNAIAQIGDRIARLRDGVVLSVDTNDHPVAPEEVQW